MHLKRSMFSLLLANSGPRPRVGNGRSDGKAVIYIYIANTFSDMLREMELLPQKRIIH